MTLLKLGLGHFRSQFFFFFFFFRMQYALSINSFKSFLFLVLRKTFHELWFFDICLFPLTSFSFRDSFYPYVGSFLPINNLFFSPNFLPPVILSLTHPSLPPKIFESMIWSTISLPPWYLQTILHQLYHWPDLLEIWLSPRTGHLSPEVRGFSSFVCFLMIQVRSGVSVLFVLYGP